MSEERGERRKTRAIPRRLGFSSPQQELPPVRPAYDGLSAFGGVADLSPARRFPFFALGFFGVFFGWWGGGDIPKLNKVIPALSSVVRLASVEGTWSCVSNKSPRTWSVFVFVGVVSGLALPIYSSHHWRCSLLWCAALVLWGLRRDFSSVYYNNIYYELCLARVMEDEVNCVLCL
jgi:hypothetical protein